MPGNCSSIIYLGGGSETTAKFFSELLGKTTIYSKDVTMQKNKDIGFDEALRKQARDLRTPDEVLRLPPKQAIVHLAGSFPFQDDRFELKKHPNYQYLAESSKRMFTTDLRLKEEARMLLFE
ncbi:MAG: TraM recognition domain-containing protein [Caldisericum sp.]